MINKSGFRYVNEAVGGLVLLALLFFLGTVLQAGLLRQWFNPPLSLRVLLPPDGVAGLSAGAEVEVLGTRAGAVRRIVIDPNQRMHAEVSLDPAMRTFVRKDSQAVIRKRFGIAGAAYLDVSRGEQTPLDWNFAVIEATTERAPTESVGQLIEEVRLKIFPIINDTHQAIQTVAAIVKKLNNPDGDVQLMVHDVRELTRRIEQGEGAIGRLLNNDTLVRELEITVKETNLRLQQAKSILASLEATTREAGQLTRDMRLGTDRTLQNVQSITSDLAKATPALPTIAKNLAATTASLPQVIVQTQQTALELEKLINQLRSHWLLGGGKASDAPAAERQPARQVRP